MKMLDKSRPFAEIYGLADHVYEQDGLRFDRDGHCLDALEGARSARQVAAESAPEAPAGLTSAATQNIESLGLSHKVENALLGAGLATVEALTKATEEELLALPNVGAAAVKEIKKKLKAANQKLAG